MPVTSTWASVPYVKGHDVYGQYDSDYVSAELNTRQQEALQSRDQWLKDRFNDFYDKDQIDNLFSQYTTNLDWKESVDTFEDILTLYPTPDDGWTVNVKDTNYTYRYDEEEDKWIPISANSIPLATIELDGLLSKKDYSFIRSLGIERVLTELGFLDQNGNIIDLEGVLSAGILPKIYERMNQMEERALPLGSIIPYVNEGDIPPDGFVFAEGGVYQREEYPDMWAKLCLEPDDGYYCIEDSERDIYPGRFTKGLDNYTFRVPNLQGVFVRGLDINKDIDLNRLQGSYQNDSIKEHSHTVDVAGVGSIDDSLIINDRLVLAGTTPNEYTDSAVVTNYKSTEAETRPKNVALRFIIKMIPTEKLPITVDPMHMPDIETEIDADKLNGHVSSIVAASGNIPVAGPNGKLDSSWFDLTGENGIGGVFDDYFVHQSETSTVPDSNKIPYSNSRNNLDDWISIVSIETVDAWIDYLSTTDYELPEDDYDDAFAISKEFITKRKFVRFLKGLKAFIRTFKQVYTTEEIEPTNDRGYISNAERVKYSDKYTKNETYQLLFNFLQSYIPLTDATTVPTPNKIPIANSDGKLDPGWMSDLFLNKIGENENTGYVEVADTSIDIKAGIPNTTDTLQGKVTIEGGGTFNYSELSPAKAVITSYDMVENKGGNVEIYAGSGGTTNPTGIGGSVVIQSGTGYAYDGTIDLNNIKVDKNNTIYTNRPRITLKQDNGNDTNYLELSADSLTYMHDDIGNDRDDYRFTLNKDGTVETNKPNIANSLTILNDKALVPFENLPKTVIVNNIGEFNRDQSINTALGNVIYGEIKQNITLTIDDAYYNSDESKELTFILKSFGPYNVTWPVNIIWISGHTPFIDMGEYNIIKLFRIGNAEWLGWKVGDGSGSGSGSDILINDTEVPPEEFTGKLHIYVENIQPYYPDSVEKVESFCTVEVNDITIDEDAIVNVTVPRDATGEVSINIDGDDLGSEEIPEGNNTVRFTLTDFTEGEKVVTVTYLGDDKYKSSVGTATFTVSKYTGFCIPSAEDIVLTEDALITVSVPEDATGNVTIDINNAVQMTQSVSNGYARFTVQDLSVGEKTLTATYSGDNRYASSTGTTTFTVADNTNSNIFKFSITNTSYGEEPNLNVILKNPEDANNYTAALVLNDESPISYTFDNNGQINALLPLLDRGNYTAELRIIDLNDNVVEILIKNFIVE